MKNLEAAGQVVGSIWNAESVKVEKISTDGQTDATMSVTLNKLSNIPDDYPAFQIASSSAMAFIQNLQPKELETFQIVVINFQLNGSLQSFQYKVEDVKDAISLTNSVTEFLDASYQTDINGLKNYVENSMLPDSVLSMLRDGLLQYDGAYGKTVMNKIGGFKFSKIENTQEPVVIYYAAIVKEGMQIPMTFYVSRKTGKIVSLSTQG